MIKLKERHSNINGFTGDIVWASSETVRIMNFNYQIILRLENGRSKFNQHSNGQMDSFR